MLVLTRKLQQQIKIGDQITVTILRVKGNAVRVGISAPRDVRVIRGELPKGSEAADTEQITVDAISVCEEAAPAVDDSAGPVAEMSQESAAQPPAMTLPLANQLPLASHLPLRRIANRHGAAPLKQVVAACSTLAK